MAAVLLLGGAVIPALPGVSIRSAAAADEPRDSAHVSAGTGLAYYEITSGDATVLHVARQFWAIPREG